MAMKQSNPARVSYQALETGISRQGQDGSISLMQRALQQTERVILVAELPMQLGQVPCFCGPRLELIQNGAGVVQMAGIY